MTIAKWVKAKLRYGHALSDKELIGHIHRMEAPENNRCGYAAFGNSLNLRFARHELKRRQKRGLVLPLALIPCLLATLTSIGAAMDVRGVSATTNGVLLFPTNFFQTNLTRLRAELDPRYLQTNISVGLVYTNGVLAATNSGGGSSWTVQYGAQTLTNLSTNSIGIINPSFGNVLGYNADGYWTNMGVPSASNLVGSTFTFIEDTDAAPGWVFTGMLSGDGSGLTSVNAVSANNANTASLADAAGSLTGLYEFYQTDDGWGFSGALFGNGTGLTGTNGNPFLEHWEGQYGSDALTNWAGYGPADFVAYGEANSHEHGSQEWFTSATNILASSLRTNASLELLVQQAKLPATNNARLDGGFRNWELWFDKTNASGASLCLTSTWSRIVPYDYTTNTLAVEVLFTVIATNGPNASNLIWRASVMSVAPNEASDVRAKAFDTAVKFTNAIAASHTATNQPFAALIDLANKTGGAQGGNLLHLQLERDAVNDQYGNTAQVLGVLLRYRRQ